LIPELLQAVVAAAIVSIKFIAQWVFLVVVLVIFFSRIKNCRFTNSRGDLTFVFDKTFAL